MKIQYAWAEGADDEVVSFEGLVRGWRHMVLADDGREVIDVEACRGSSTHPSPRHPAGDSRSTYRSELNRGP